MLVVLDCDFDVFTKASRTIQGWKEKVKEYNNPVKNYFVNLCYPLQDTSHSVIQLTTSRPPRALLE